jgi:type I restriction enzyme M protein
MNADDFRDYMLSFLFLRYLSDNYEAAAKKELRADYPDPGAIGNGGRTPLSVWYANNPGRRGGVRKADAPQGALCHQAGAPLGTSIVHLAKTQDGEAAGHAAEGIQVHRGRIVLRATSRACSRRSTSARTSWGATYDDRNAKLCSIISEIAGGLAEFSTDVDTLGDAYEYLIGQFAAGSGKKAGEFYTPQQISDILSGIVTLDSQEPEDRRAEDRLTSVLDFACGSGSLLLNVRTAQWGRASARSYGTGEEHHHLQPGRMNMLLHGVKDSEFEIYHGDTLTNDWDMLRETNPAKKPAFDAVVANPPFSYRWDPRRGHGRGHAVQEPRPGPQSAADFAFLLHGFHYLKDDGVMAIILPHGVLFRGGAEERIRTKLLKDGHIDTVIGLPANLFYSTGIPVCILVLKKCKKPDDVLFINASEHFVKGKRQNQLTDEHIEDHQHVSRPPRKPIERYSRRVKMKSRSPSERLQPQHLPLRQHGGSGRGDRPGGDSR